MRDIPLSALILTAAGVIPFVLSAVTVYAFPQHSELARFASEAYAVVILCFMSGVLWGFASSAAQDNQFWAYGFSTVPALYVFFVMLAGFLKMPLSGIGPLALGFIAILGLDFRFQKAGLAPDWWMSLRIPVTLIVAICLFLVGAR